MYNTHYISFPGLGIEEFKLERVAFTIFGHPVMWYGIIITLGIIAGFLYVMYRSKFEGISADDVYDFTIFTVVLAILGARIYYVVTDGVQNYIGDTVWQTLYNLAAIWEGGIAIYGAIIAGGLTIVVICAIKKLKPMKVLDMVAPGVMLGQIIGRWGNFVNAEAHGYETDIFIRMGIRNEFQQTATCYHPTFLYESLWNLVGFIIINAVYKKKKFDGANFLLYISWYGFGRMFIEGLRTDSLYVGSIRISQIVGFLCFAVGTLLFIGLSAAARSHRLEVENASKGVETVEAASEQSEQLDEAAQADNAETAATGSEKGKKNRK